MRRFAFLSRAALEFVLLTGKRPDVIHAHDWQRA
jgi:starch synthase